jgi:hypothetical protein
MLLRPASDPGSPVAAPIPAQDIAKGAGDTVRMTVYLPAPFGGLPNSSPPRRGTLSVDSIFEGGGPGVPILLLVFAIVLVL